MTTLEQLEAKLLAALTTEANFQAAKSDLRLENLLKNGRGTLEDCAAFLSDDGRSVAVYANWHDDAATIYSRFELSQPSIEEEFDANRWAVKLMQGDE